MDLEERNKLMKKKLILTVSILTILLGGCTPQTQPAATTENTEVTENVQLSAENIFGGMQRYIEDSFQTCFADYYFNGRSSNASAYFYNKADVTEISKICQKIYNAEFQYDQLNVEEKDDQVKITLPVNIFNSQYVIIYEGICHGNGEYTFNAVHIFDESNQDLATNQSISISKTITAQDTYKTEREQKIDYYKAQGFTCNPPQLYTAAQPPAAGIYYLNGEKDGEAIEILPDNQISVAGNTYYYKCMKNGDENVLFWLYSLKLYPFENLQVYPYQLEYEGDQLFYNNQKYILE